MNPAFRQAWVIIMAGERVPFAAFLSEARARQVWTDHKCPPAWEIRQIPHTALPPGLPVQV